MYTIKLWHPYESIEKRLKEANYKVGETLDSWQLGDFVKDVQNVNLNVLIVGHEIFVDTGLFRQR